MAKRYPKYNESGALLVAPTTPITASPLLTSEVTLTLPGVGGTYAAQDAVSAASPAPLLFENVHTEEGGTGYIVKAWIESSTAIVANGVFRLWLFNAAPTNPAANDAAQPFLKADKAKRIGYIDFALLTEGTGSDGAYALDDGLRLPFTCAEDDTDLYGIVIAKAGYVWGAAQTLDFGLMTELA